MLHKPLTQGKSIAGLVVFHRCMGQEHDNIAPDILNCLQTHQHRAQKKADLVGVHGEARGQVGRRQL